MREITDLKGHVFYIKQHITIIFPGYFLIMEILVEFIISLHIISELWGKYARGDDMSAYTGPIQTAIIIFAIIAFIIFIPWLIYTYRKYGFLSISKTVVVFSFIFYFLTALFLVLLPLPETTNTCALQKPDTKFFNLQPFKFLEDIKRNTNIAYSDPSTWMQIIKQPSFYQAFFNFLLLMPLGVYLLYFFKGKRKWLTALFAGFALSAFYEITQVTGIYGIYNCPYRIFDVDDLILNTAGAFIGFLLAPILLAFIPDHEDVVEKAEEVQKEKHVGSLQYLLAVLIDFVLIDIITSLIAGENMVLETILKLILFTIVFALIPFIFKGQTIGMKLLKLQLAERDRTPVKATSILKRFAAIVGVYLLFVLMRIFNQVELNMDSAFYELQILITLVSFFFVIALMLVLAWHVVRVLFARGKRRLYFDQYAKVKVVKKQKNL